jgi:hypothetical protein
VWENFMLARLHLTFLSFILALVTGCARNPAGTRTVTRPAKVLSPPIRTAQKWNPLWSLGNADDPEPPTWYRPASPNRRWLWQTRNPMHNFTHYVIGVTDKDTTRTGKYPSEVFAPDGGWNWAYTKRGCLRLPFVSYAGKRSRFYLGWRESGNFGGKLNFKRTDEKPAQPAQAAAKSP